MIRDRAIKMAKFVTLLNVVLIFNSARSATRCYQCSSAMNSQCTEPLLGDLPNQCINNTNNEVNCYIYKYNTTEDVTHIVRGCKEEGETCEQVKDALNAEHKKYIDCFLCKENLCNNITQTRSDPLDPSAGNMADGCAFIIFPLLLLATLLSKINAK